MSATLKGDMPWLSVAEIKNGALGLRMRSHEAEYTVRHKSHDPELLQVLIDGQHVVDDVPDAIHAGSWIEWLYQEVAL